jgi:hypothetical protein
MYKTKLLRIILEILKTTKRINLKARGNKWYVMFKAVTVRLSDIE